MSELLPTIQAERIRSSLVDYLTTTFALSDAEVSDGLDRFLSDPSSGMFKGPYVRLRLPFRPAADGWRDSLDWYAGPTPYGHQAAAFRRLSSSIAGQRRRPEPTLVTTGTGSGKTEAFLYPIVDHVLRAKRDGVTGTKALILYPMNALANDQAKRLTELLTTHAELGAITAALYTGQDGPKRTSVTRDGLITDRAIIRDSAPDILLTNYKMLDQLLLRFEDQELWRQSALSLQYLVLDEFHTYDGAQGTDVAMLLRRLGLALKSHWRDDDPAITDDDRVRPLGRITPVATSATLGEKGDPDVMLGFAETVFGETFGSDAVITESRLELAEWVGNATNQAAQLGVTPVEAARLDLPAALDAIKALDVDPDGADLARVVLGFLYVDDDDVIATASAEELLTLTRAHPLVQRLAAEAGDALALDDLVMRSMGDSVSFGRHGQGADWVQVLAQLVAAIGHVRKVAGRGALSVDAHLWVRELTRVDRSADTSATFRWGDDGPPIAGDDHDEARPSFPAIYCRHCGRSGWGVGLSPVGESLDAEDESIRRNHAQREGRFRALIHAPSEAENDLRDGTTAEGLVWFSVRGRTLEQHRPDEDDPELVDGWYLPVLTLVGPDADQNAKDDACPACGQADGIRFLGSAIATLLSVSLSTLFGSASLDSNEKKALVFTDSVQDAAHRAGFIRARSHALTLRGVLRASIAGGAVSLDQLVEEVIRDAGDDPFARYRILSPDCADRTSFEGFWKEPRARGIAASVRTRVRTRLALDIALEFGLNARLGRTLELTGSAAAEVDAGQPARMAGVASRHRGLPVAGKHRWPTKRRHSNRLGSRGAGSDEGTRCHHPPVVRHLHPGGRQPVADLRRAPAQRGHARLPARTPGTRLPPRRRPLRPPPRQRPRPGDEPEGLVRDLDVPDAVGQCCRRWAAGSTATRPAQPRWRPHRGDEPIRRDRLRTAARTDRCLAHHRRRPRRRALPAHLRDLSRHHPRVDHHRRPARRCPVPCRPVPRAFDPRSTGGGLLPQPLQLPGHATRGRPRAHQSARRQGKTRLRDRFQIPGSQPAVTQRSRRHPDARDGHRHR